MLDNLRSLQRCLKRLDVSGCKLAEGAIPSDLWSLYSLKSLDTSRNDIRSIPAGIVQLSKLNSLDIGYCELLEEIPKLPLSLRRMWARGCPSLESSASNPSSKLWSSLVISFKSCTEVFYIELTGKNGIPEWVRHKNMGGEVTIHLPPDWYNDINLLGFAVFFYLNPPRVDAPNKCFGPLRCKMIISGGDQFEKVYSHRSYPDQPHQELAMIYVPQIEISGNCGSNKWRKLKAYLSFDHDDNNWKSYEETFPGTCKGAMCGIHPICEKVHQQQNEKARLGRELKGTR